MIERIIDISDAPARLSVRNDQLVIESPQCDPATVPLKEMAVLVLAHPQASVSHAVLSGIAENGGSLVACDSRRLPTAMMLPIRANALQTERFARQAALGLPRRKRLWQQLVQAKIAAQAAALTSLGKADHGLAAMAARVRSGDPSNLEAQAARRYWKALLGLDLPEGFTRDPDGSPPNDMLNYGYGVLRATVARAVCSAGLHPSFGLHHHNRYNPFCLADDLMEPLRPLVDRAAVQWIASNPLAPLGRESKAAMIAALTGRVRIEGESRTLFDALSIVAASLAAVVMGQRTDLVLPEPPVASVSDATVD